MWPWTPTHQFSKSLRDILRRLPRLVAGARPPLSPPPRVPFVIRVGGAGPLDLGGESESVSRAVGAILFALKEYAEGAAKTFDQIVFTEGTPLPPQVRLISQLAAGFDQMAASTAADLGYSLHVVLPGDRAAFRNDIARNLSDEQPMRDAESPQMFELDCSPSGALRRFDELYEVADRVLELDWNYGECRGAFKASDYEQAARIILDHSDVVLVVTHPDRRSRAGGTRWIEQRAEENGLVIIRVPAVEPAKATLTWTTPDGRREQRHLFAVEAARESSWKLDSGIISVALDDGLLGPPCVLSKTQPGWLERRMLAQLDIKSNADEWDKRWNLGSSDPLVRRDLGLAPQQIDADLKDVKAWADWRASAMAELVRGSFIMAALIGVLAVFASLIGIVAHAVSESGMLVALLSYGGKMAEIGFLFLISWLIQRSRRFSWRSQWLSLRQMERFLEQAAWLLLLGRACAYTPPPHLTQFQTDAVATWTNMYFRAVVRHCSFPNVRFSSDYLKTVHELALRNLIFNQISYMEGEIRFQQRSDEVLELWTNRFVKLALLLTAIYLCYRLSGLLLQKEWPTLVEAAERMEPIVRSVVSVFGAVFTAMATALAAVRSHGEYGQIAARYEGTLATLRGISSRLTARLPDLQPDFSPPTFRSATLAAVIRQATDALIQEVQGWRAILQTKEIEPA
jgi:hypothetical protein